MNLEDLIDPDVEEHLTLHLWRKSKMPAARAIQTIRATAMRITQEHRGPLSHDRFNVQLMDAIDPPVTKAAKAVKVA